MVAYNCGVLFLEVRIKQYIIVFEKPFRAKLNKVLFVERFEKCKYLCF